MPVRSNYFFVLMKNLYAIPGAILLIVGILLIAGFSSSLGQGLNYIGISNQQAVSTTGTILVSLKSTNYSSIQFNMTSTSDVMTATIQSNPQGIDAFIMNEGNYSIFDSSGGDTRSVYIYKPHPLNISSTTITFTTNTVGLYRLVFTIPINGVKPDVIVDLTVSETISSPAQNDLPYAIIVIGIVLLAIGVMSSSGGTPTPVAQKKPQQPQAQRPQPQQMPKASVVQSGSPAAAQKAITLVKCKYCGATMKPNQVFCPSCTRSQV